MKNILFLILICVIKLSAYEYLFFDNFDDSTSYTAKYRWFTDASGNLRVKIEDKNGGVSYGDVRNSYLFFIRYNDSHYITNSDFQNIYKNNLDFLNDLFNQCTNGMLNYFYNSSRFGDYDYINYDNYELLYNSDGQAVESIVDGVWAGLYSDSEKDISGKLYSVDGQLIYNNGEEVNWFGALFDKLTGGFGASFTGCFYVLGNVLIYVLIVYFVWNMFYFILKIGKSAINKKESV